MDSPEQVTLLNYEAELQRRRKDSSMSSRTSLARVLRTAETRRQIIDAVLVVVSECGVPGASISRIAKAAGVAEGTLYVHFESRTDMLLAALDAIFMQMMEIIDASTESDPLERLRGIGRRHTQLMRTERGGFAYPWVEFIAAGPQVGVRCAVVETQRKAFRVLRDIVEQGKRQGSFREDVDSDRLTWEFLTFAWAEDMSCLMGLDEYMDDGHSAHVLDLILNNAAARGTD